MTYKKLCELKALDEGVLLGIRVDDVNLVVLRVGGRIHAYEDQCAHRGVKLSHGMLVGNALLCPAHHWQYDATTGKGVTQPLVQLKKFEIKVDGDDVLVRLA